jgi:hypothetical protein
MSTTLPRPRQQLIGESRGRKNLLPKIKAPFRLTTMNQRGKSSLIWVWSRRGNRWTVDQELRFHCDSKRDKGGL